MSEISSKRPGSDIEQAAEGVSVSASGARRVARIVLASPLSTLDRLFDYEIPARLAAQVRAGVRVKVPFGTRRRRLEGFVVEVADSTDHPGPLAEIGSVVSPVPVLAPGLWRLARAVADRQGGNASDVLRLAIPPRHASTEKAVRGQAVVGGGPLEGERRSPGRRTALTVRAGGATVQGRWMPAWAVEIGRRCALQAEEGRGSIVAVPDQRDLDVLGDALAAGWPDLRVVRTDASQDDATRYAAFLHSLRGSVDVVLGNRSALYSPLPNLGLLVVWQDGDPLMAEPLAPYPHARDVALVRQQQSSCDLVFASHSRSTAVQRLIELGWLAEETVGAVPTVIPGSALEPMDLEPARMPSTVWQMASAVLESGGSVLLQAARRGYARALLCAECHTPARCTKCGGPLGLERDALSPPSCRWCGRPAGSFHCSVCGGTRLRQASPGIARTAEDVGRAFPRSRVVVSTGERPVTRVDGGRAVVLATPGVEPLPADRGYPLVIVLDGELMLGMEGLTAAEDALRQWFTAAALADPEGRVVVLGVEGRLARALQVWNPGLFAAEELAARREAGFPPSRRIGEVTGPVGSTLRIVEDAGLPDEVRILGTAPVDPGSEGRGGGAREAERTLFTLPYSRGVEVAALLKASVMRAPHRYAEWGIQSPAPSARLRFDTVAGI